MESKLSALSANMVEGSINDFKDDSIIIGKELAHSIGTFKGDRVKVLSAEGRLTPLGTVPRMRTFEVVGIFSSGLYDYDNSWVYVPINAAQRLFGLGDIASHIEVKIKDLDQAKVIGKQIVDRVGRDLDLTDWMTQNHAIFQALQLERLVMFITIGLIVLVAVLNIVALLLLMLLIKTSDITIL